MDESLHVHHGEEVEAGRTSTSDATVTPKITRERLKAIRVFDISMCLFFHSPLRSVHMDGILVQFCNCLMQMF